MSTKISQLTSATDVTASDFIQIVDVEDGVMAPSGTNKKITAQLLADNLVSIVSNGSIAASKLASGALPSGVTVSSTNIVNGTIVDADINASAAIAGSKISPSFTAPSVISVNSSSDALLITQTGSGNALVVEDSTNPDSTPFVIGANGNVGIGTSSPQEKFDLNGAQIIRNDAVTGWAMFVPKFGTDPFGANYDRFDLRVEPTQQITYLGNTHGGTGSARDLGLVTGAIERIRITSTGNVGIGTGTPSSKLHVAGDLTMSSATLVASATAGANGDVPAMVGGYLAINLNGVACRIPYYLA